MFPFKISPVTSHFLPHSTPLEAGESENVKNTVLILK
ncbi:hypothetical protein SSUST1_0741 [Streptococcus suis ST1]|nr:hypothetical protein SSUST1_0741 [Streptococcus suis ST1]CAR46212.1 hypothetical protein SSU1060 [Streptococcus suis P1/7]